MRRFIAALAIVGAFIMGSTAVHAQNFEWVVDEIDVYEMRVLRIGVRRMTVDIDGVGRRSFRVPADFRFYIDGQPMRLNQLQVRQRLTAYVSRSESGTYQLVDAGPVRATPPAAPAKAPVVAEPAPLPDDMMTLPKTGVFLPFTLGLSLVAGMLALGLRLRRRAA